LRFVHDHGLTSKLGFAAKTSDRKNSHQTIASKTKTNLLALKIILKIKK
jgi:hypothetical protein